MILNENPTRQKLLILLKKTEHMTVLDLSKEVGITPMAVRQHLMSLEKKGIVNYTVKKNGIGRPVYLYKLTEDGIHIFPKAYNKFIVQFLESIEKMDGPDKVDAIFRMKKDHHLDELNKVITPEMSLRDRLITVGSILNKDGAMVEIEERAGTYCFRKYNCILSEVSRKYPSECKYELELYRDLFGINLQRETWLREGANSCTYIIDTNGA